MELDQLKRFIFESAIPYVVTNPRWPDNPIVAANDAFTWLTGYEQTDVIGRNPRLLQAEGADPTVLEMVRTSIAAGRSALVELINYRRDGSAFRNAMMIAPCFDETGKLVFFVGSQLNAPLLERQQRARAMVATLSPRQKEILRLMSLGYRNKQIAHMLSLTLGTVRVYRAITMTKLGAKSSAEAVRIAIEAGV